MAQETQFAIGAKASCSDGSCGEVRRLVIDPATDTVTHLVIQPGHGREAGRLVPLDLVEATAGEIRLRCTRAEFDKLEHAEERDVAERLGLPPRGEIYGAGATPEAYVVVGPGELMDAGPARVYRKVIIEDVVPVGEIQVRPGDHVHAADGEIGRVRGCLVDPADHRVTHVLLQEGHLWGHKEVAIPIGAVTGVEDGIRLNITKHQVGNLPPVDINHPS
jgi:sporulation protein YlmC with PRC-barrel domain